MRNLNLIPGDRRSDRRYGHELEVRFRYGPGHALTGFGVTVDFSRRGIRFRTETPPPVGAEIELCIAWPFRLQNVVPLQLMIEGAVLRHDDLGIAVAIGSYTFRTCGEASFDPAYQPDRTCVLTA